MEWYSRKMKKRNFLVADVLANFPSHNSNNFHNKMNVERNRSRKKDLRQLENGDERERKIKNYVKKQKKKNKK